MQNMWISVFFNDQIFIHFSAISSKLRKLYSNDEIISDADLAEILD